VDRFEERRRELEAELGEPVTVDGLTMLPGRAFRIFQRKRGHRHSTDDLLTAWLALEHAPNAPSTLDLGTGIGSVGLLVLAGLPEDGMLTCIEAQSISYRFLTENIRANAIETRVRPLHGDLRELASSERFPLVTGSPPYFDVTAGIVPADSQKAHARFELRGDVGDYVRAAKRHLSPDGRFVFCFPFAQLARALAAVEREGLTVIDRRDVVPRVGLAPLFSVFACRVGEGKGSIEPFVVREADGAHTSAMRAVRARFGWA
jgi:tRNA1(Val) A37 N6-methylase TrmN6